MSTKTSHHSLRSKSLTILVQKKDSETNLENYGSLRLLYYLYEFYTRVITSRLENSLHFCQPKKQAGFRSVGTSDHLQTIVIEKTILYNRPLVIIFVDFQKVRVGFNFKRTETMQVDQRYDNIIQHMYTHANQAQEN